jgi:5-methyltetrahydrofolate--homocysteine methyltransferase
VPSLPSDFLLIGERLNAHGSRTVRRMILDGDDAGLVAIARDQIAAGAHALDVCTALEAGDDEAGRMEQVIAVLAGSVDVRLAIDSTDPDVIERALDRLGPRAIVNSINMAGRTTAERLGPAAMRHGADVIALSIDEAGMARTRWRKLEIARAIYDRLVIRQGLPPERLLIDPLTFPMTTDGMESMVETIEGVRLIAAEFPDVRTLVGVSDVSFRMAPAARPGANAGFLQRCVDAGLRAAILNPRDVC